MKTHLLMTAAAAALMVTGASFAQNPSANGPPASLGVGVGAGAENASPQVPAGAPLGKPAVTPQDDAARSGDSIGASVSGAAQGDVDSGANAGANANANANANLNANITADERQAASLLGGLNAARASSEGMANASADSMAGAVANYKTAMGAALQMDNATQKSEAITAARVQLASSSNKTLTADAVTSIDATLGIEGADPTLGTTSQ